MRKVRLRWLAPLLLVLFHTSLWAQDGPPGVPVRVAKASLQLLVPVTIVPGTVISRNDANLAAEVSGRLLEMADVGTPVAAGGVVAVIEATQLILKRDENRAQVTRAKARLKFLENEERRIVTLAESNLAAATKLEEARSDRDVARGDLQVATSRLAQTEDQISRTRITAPFDGIVVERLMMPGERVTAGNNVVNSGWISQLIVSPLARPCVCQSRLQLPGRPWQSHVMRWF